jgi:hypothetical protein
MALGRLLTISSLTIISGEVPGLAETFTIRYKIVSPYADLDCLQEEHRLTPICTKRRSRS